MKKSEKKYYCDECYKYCSFECERYGCGTLGAEVYEYDDTACREFEEFESSISEEE